MKKITNYKLLFAFFAMFMAGCNTNETKVGAVPGTENISIEVPGYVEGHPGLVPVNVDISSGSGNRISEVVLDIPSNTAGHQNALRLKLTNPQKKLQISTRVRVQAASEPTVRVISIDTTGRSNSQEAKISGIVNAVDFSNAATLSPMWEPSSLFPSRQLGERHTAFKKAPGGMIDLATAIYHPNFPKDVGSEANSMDRIQGFVAGKQIFTVLVSSGLSNNPFLRVYVPSEAIAERTEFTVKWNDSKGNQFEGNARFGKFNHQL